MNDMEDEKIAKMVVLFLMMGAAATLTAITVGMFFGAQWGFALLALCAIIAFMRARNAMRKDAREDETE